MIGKQQRKQILNYLLINETMTTIQSKELLGIMHPAGRVKELRKAEWPIGTNEYKQVDAAGIEHSAGQYFLQIEKLTPEQKAIKQTVLADIA